MVTPKNTMKSRKRCLFNLQNKERSNNVCNAAKLQVRRLKLSSVIHVKNHRVNSFFLMHDASRTTRARPP